MSKKLVHRLLGVFLALAATLSLVACGSASSSTTASGQSGGDAGTLRIQHPGPPVSLNPALGSTGRAATFSALAYDPLIYLTGDGQSVPDLATSWKYTDTDNKVFELTLRDGVKFMDGTTMDATAVAASMNYFLTAGGGTIRYVGPVDTVEAVDAKTVRITYKASFADAPISLSQYYGLGLIIGPKGLAAPDSLLSSSDGTGQYTYDAASSVTNNHYDYTKNPTYWNPAAQQYQAVSVKVIGDPNSVLSAIKTGQVDLASGNPTTADSATSAGITVQTPTFYTWSLILADRTGEVSKPLADERVRQAIGYALDRDTLAGALGGQYLVPDGQIVQQGTNGYVDGAGYNYNLDKAKQLMADAGYPDGFDLTILTQSILDPNATYSQAIASALSDIGINATLQVESTGIAQFSQQAQSKQYAAIIYPIAGIDTAAVAQQIMSPSGGTFNPWKDADPQARDLLSQAAATSDEAQRTELYQQASARFTELGWVIPVFTAKSLVYVGKSVNNVKTSVINPNAIPVGPAPEYAWQPAAQ